MVALTPTSTPQDTNGVYAIIALISDATAAKKRLDELNKVAEDARTTLEQATAASRQAEADRRATAKAVEDLKAREAQLDELHARRVADLAARESALADHEADFQQMSAETKRQFSDRQTKLDAKEADLVARETALATRETDIAAKEAAASAAKLEWETKAAKVRKAAAALED